MDRVINGGRQINLMVLAINCVSQYQNLYVFSIMVENVTK